MTLEDVKMTVETLQREGALASYNVVLARLGHGSKRDVARFMRQLTADVPVPPLSDPPVPALPDFPVPLLSDLPVAALAALGADPPLPPPSDPPLPPSDPPLPPEPPLPPAAEASPLHQARQARDQTAAQELALGQQEQALKQARKGLEEQLLQLAISAPVSRSDAADLAGRRQLAEVRRQLMQGVFARTLEAVH